MSFVPLALTVILAAIAALHGYWTAGGLWPGRSPAELARIVVGNAGATHMPGPKLSGVVTAMLAVAAAWPLLLLPLLRTQVSDRIAIAVTILIGAIFLLRGIIGYSAAMRRRHPAEPFATYNRRYYSPLCLLLGGGFLILAANGGMA